MDHPEQSSPSMIMATPHTPNQLETKWLVLRGNISYMEKNA
jgi:hypothetical protein